MEHIGLILATIMAVVAAEPLATVVAVAGNAEEQKYQDGVEFNNNLASDLSPLLALFGERFAQQFMSFSTTYLDSVVFSMAPLGIITAIVGAIRVGGPSWLRGLVGRARETRAAAEVELMSSTSHEVCELWNGDAIVRVMGSPRIQQLIYISNAPKELRRRVEEAESTSANLSEEEARLGKEDADRLSIIKQKFPVFTLTEAVDLKLVLRKSSNPSSFERSRKKTIERLNSLVNKVRKKQPTSDDQEPGSSKPRLNKEAPNISMNLSIQKKPWELYLATVIGVFSQAAVLALAAYTAYNAPSLKFNKAGLTVPSYSYPLATAGTLLLVTGMFLAASIVEQSTHEETYEKHEDMGDAGLFIFWIQKSRVINDQAFDSYAIIAEGPLDAIRTSRRQLPHKDSTSNSSPLMRYFTVLGTVTSVTGFVLQFIGLRSMHWSASTAQLAATILMTIVRAILRRGMSKRPSAVKLPKDFELEWLATQLAKHEEGFGDHFSKRDNTRNDDSWCTLRVLTGGTPAEKNTDEIRSNPWGQGDTQRPSPQQGHSSFWRQAGLLKRLWSGSKLGDAQTAPERSIRSAKELVDIRQRVGQLSQWTGPASDNAVALGNAIEVVLNTLLPPNVRSAGTETEEFTWVLDVQTGCGGVQAARNGGSVGQEAGDGNGGGQDAGGGNGGDDTNDQKIVLRAVVKGGNKKSWQADVDQIEALLSLWLRHAHCSEAAPKSDSDMPKKNWLRDKPRKQGMLFLGPDTLLLRRDLRWWVPGDGSASLLQVRMPSDQATSQDAEPNTYRISSQRITGFYGPGQPDGQAYDSRSADYTEVSFDCQAVSLDELGSAAQADSSMSDQDSQSPRVGSSLRTGAGRGVTTARKSLGMVTTTSQESLFAQHIFTAFMAVVAQKVDRIGGKTEASQATTSNYSPSVWQHFRLQNTVITKMALGLQNAGLTKSLEEAYLCLIPPLSLQYKLPSGAAVDTMLRNLQRFESDFNWEKSTEAYLDLIEVAKQFGVASCPFALKAAIAVVEYLKRVANNSNLHFEEKPDLKELERQVRESLEKLISDEVRKSLRLLYIRQERWGEYETLLSRRQSGRRDEHQRLLDSAYNADTKDVPIAAYVGFSKLHQKICAGEEWDKEEGRRYKDEQDVAGWSPLHYAICRNKIDCVNILVEQGADVNLQDISGWSPLHYAARKGKIPSGIMQFVGLARHDAHARDGTYPVHWAAKHSNEFLSMLLQQGARVDVQDAAKRTPLHWAALAKNSLAIASLLGRASPAVRDFQGSTPLHLAATTGNCKCIELLLNGSDLEAKGQNSRTPIMLAAVNGHLAAVEFLQERKASIKAKDVEGRTALHLAVSRGHDKLVDRLLVQRGEGGGGGGTVEWRQQVAEGAVGKAEKIPEDVDGKHDQTSKGTVGKGDQATDAMHDGTPEATDNEFLQATDNLGRTPLHIAALYGHESTVKLLLTRKANRRAKDSAGKSALYLALSEGHQEVARILLLKADLDFKSKNEEGQTLLHSVVSDGPSIVHALLPLVSDVQAKGSDEQLVARRKVVALMLLDGGVDVNQKDNKGRTAFHLATLNGHEAMVPLLLSRGANLDAIDNGSKTALHLAVDAGNEHLTRLLLERGASHEIANSSGDTPLLSAVKNAVGVSLVRCLINHGANTKAKDTDGRTPVHHAIRIGNMEILQLVLRGADLNAQDNLQNSALHLASKRSREEAVGLLLQNGASIDVRNAKGRTALHLAAKRWNSNIVRALLDHASCTTDDGAKHEGFCALQDNAGNTALHLACKSHGSWEDITKMLIDSGSPLDIENNDGAIPMSFLLERTRVGLAEVMLEKGVSMTKALNLASATGIESMVTAILSKDASIISTTDKDGNTALHHSLLGGQHGFTDLLIHKKAPVDVQNNDGLTPLHIACQDGCPGCVRALLNVGARPNITDKAGRTPLSKLLAEGRKNSTDSRVVRSVELLLQFKADVSIMDEHGWVFEQIVQSYEWWDELQELSKKPSSFSQSVPSSTALPPTAWSTTDKHPDIQVGNNGLDSVYPTPSYAPALGRANHPFPPQPPQTSTSDASRNGGESFNAATYFEISVVKTDDESNVGLGLCKRQNVNFRQMPGWFDGTFGYHGDDGQKYLGSGDGLLYSRAYKVGDIVGCGVDKGGNLFFTKNGVHLGIAHRGLSGQLFPIVGTIKDSHITANFGATPFKYNPGVADGDASKAVGDIRENQKNARATVDQFNLQPSTDAGHGVVDSMDLGQPPECGGAEYPGEAQGGESLGEGESVEVKHPTDAEAGDKDGSGLKGAAESGDLDISSDSASVDGSAPVGDSAVAGETLEASDGDQAGNV